MNPLAENANQYQPPKITVLMPVYNVSKFLPKCLQTLMDQTFRDFRLIAVNDGSTDNCLEILRDFEARYHNITVIDQPNRGMSMARNAALALADSKYICFVDSDDYLAPTFLQELYQAITIHDADIACCYLTLILSRSSWLHTGNLILITFTCMLIHTPRWCRQCI